MSASQHALSAFAIRSTEHSILAAFVQQKQSNMIVTKLLADHLSDTRKKFFGILEGCNRTCQLCDSLKLTSAFLNLLRTFFEFCCTFSYTFLQPNQCFLQLCSHGVEGFRELADLILRIHFSTRFQIPVSNFTGRFSEIDDGFSKPLRHE